MSSEAKDRAIKPDSRKDDVQAINRRNVLLGTSSLVAAAALTSEALAQAQPKRRPAAAPSGRKPNILVIFGDDIGIPQISAYTMGMMGYRTPNIDRIAREGAIFTDAYGQQSCTAGRASFILGQEPFRTGLLTIGMPGDPHGIQDWMPTIADVMKTQGYATGQFGKNHLGDHDEHLPTKHGFDEFFGNLYHLNAEEEPEGYFYPKDPAFRKKYRPARRHQIIGGRQDRGYRPAEHRAHADRRRGIPRRRPRTSSAGKRKANKPFFVWFNTTRMHVFTHLKPASLGKTGKGIHADGMVEHDGMVGELLKQLDDLGIADNTIVLYTTDNGAEIALWPDGAMTLFHGEKGTTWEGGIRIPMMVRWPGVVKPGTQYNDIISLIDWFPTLLRGGRRARHQGEDEDRLRGRRQDLQGPSRRLQLPALLQGRGETGAARRDLLLRPGRQPQRRPLERLEAQLRDRIRRQHRDRHARSHRPGR